jgi:hypothetical protein
VREETASPSGGGASLSRVLPGSWGGSAVLAVCVLVAFGQVYEDVVLARLARTSGHPHAAIRGAGQRSVGSWYEWLRTGIRAAPDDQIDELFHHLFHSAIFVLSKGQPGRDAKDEGDRSCHDVTSTGEVYVGAVGIDDDPVYNVVVTREQVTHLCSAAAQQQQQKGTQVRLGSAHTHRSHIRRHMVHPIGWLSSYREPRPALGTCVTMTLPSAPQETTCSSSVCGRKRALHVDPNAVELFRSAVSARISAVRRYQKTFAEWPGVRVTLFFIRTMSHIFNCSSSRHAERRARHAPQTRRTQRVSVHLVHGHGKREGQTLVSSLPEIRNLPSGLHLMVLTQPRCPSKVCTRCRRGTQHGSEVTSLWGLMNEVICQVANNLMLVDVPLEGVPQNLVPPLCGLDAAPTSPLPCPQQMHQIHPLLCVSFLF